MTLASNLKLLVLGVTLICVATASSALTMGPARGMAMLGRPLELSVPVQLDSQEEVSAPCFAADVYYGDSRQDAARVHVTSEASSQAQSVTVRVMAYVNVDEPVVTVYLRAGCGHKATRHYVLLADFATELAPPVGAVSVSEKAIREVMPNGIAKNATTAKTKSDSQSFSKVSPQPLVTAPVGQRPRLKLAVLDLAQERGPVLRSSDELMSVPIEDLQKRVQAVAIWRSLNATPQDILREDARLQSMDGDLKGMQDQRIKNQKSLQEFTGRLAIAESERYANPLVYGLAIFLFASSLSVGYLWMRLRKANLSAAPWWGGQATADETVLPEVDVGVNAAAPHSAHAPEAILSAGDIFVPVALIGKLGEVGVDLDLGDSVFSNLDRHDEPRSTGSSGEAPASERVKNSRLRDFGQTLGATLGAINTQEMLNVRQQADFFMTLGQYDEAIGVLEGCIQDSGEANPLVYLDLLKIFHTLSRKAEYDRYREAFNALFTGHVPEYRDFYQNGNALETHTDVCHQLSILWPSQGALDLIRKCLVRTNDERQQEFDLEAFRDLLMLHGVAQWIASATESNLLPFSRSNVFSEAAAAPGVTPAVGAVSVDFDLSEGSLATLKK